MNDMRVREVVKAMEVLVYDLQDEGLDRDECMREVLKSEVFSDMSEMDKYELFFTVYNYEIETQWMRYVHR